MSALQRVTLACVLVLAGCRQKKAPSLKQLSPAPLTLEATKGSVAEDPEAPRAKSRPLQGATLPAPARVLRLKSGQLELVGTNRPPAAVDAPSVLALARSLPRDRPVLLVPDSEIYLAQVAPLLAELNNSGAKVWIAAPDQSVAFPVVLRDEPAFGAWVDEPKPGKVRIIQRADGLELQTNVGKLPGPDANGPTVPLRGGELDVARLRQGLEKLQARFQSEDLCLLPSFGTELSKSVAVLSANYRAKDDPIFRTLCWVYPRPGGGMR